MGENRKSCSDWKKIRAQIGRTGKGSIQRRITEFKSADHLDPKAKEKIVNNLADLNLEQVEDQSKTLAIFYAWAKVNAEFSLWDLNIYVFQSNDSNRPVWKAFVANTCIFTVVNAKKRSVAKM